MATGPSTNPDSEWEGPKRSVIPSKSQMTASPESPKHFDFGSLSLSSKETEEKELEAAGSLDIKEELSGPGGECIAVEDRKDKGNITYTKPDMREFSSVGA